MAKTPLTVRIPLAAMKPAAGMAQPLAIQLAAPKKPRSRPRTPRVQQSS